MNLNNLAPNPTKIRVGERMRAPMALANSLSGHSAGGKLLVQVSLDTSK